MVASSIGAWECGSCSRRVTGSIGLSLQINGEGEEGLMDKAVLFFVLFQIAKVRAFSCELKDMMLGAVALTLLKAKSHNPTREKLR